jgi:hypothetical protein
VVNWFLRAAGLVFLVLLFIFRLTVFVLALHLAAFAAVGRIALIRCNEQCFF